MPPIDDAEDRTLADDATRDPPDQDGADLGEDEEIEIDADAEDDEAADHEEAADSEDRAGSRQSDDVGGRQPRRSASDTIRETRRRAQEAEARAEAATRRAEEAERRANAQQTTEAAEREREHLAILTPEEKFEYLRNKDRAEYDNKLRMLEFRQTNRDDQADFKALVRTDPLAKRHAEEVEKLHAKHWANGSHVPRETILDLVVGRNARQGREKAGTRQRARGQAAIDRETARPGRGRSDAPSQRGRTEKRAADKLADVTF